MWQAKRPLSCPLAHPPFTSIIHERFKWKVSQQMPLVSLSTSRENKITPSALFHIRFFYLSNFYKRAIPERQVNPATFALYYDWFISATSTTPNFAQKLASYGNVRVGTRKQQTRTRHWESKMQRGKQNFACLSIHTTFFLFSTNQLFFFFLTGQPTNWLATISMKTIF